MWKFHSEILVSKHPIAFHRNIDKPARHELAGDPRTAGPHARESPAEHTLHPVRDSQGHSRVGNDDDFRPRSVRPRNAVN